MLLGPGNLGDAPTVSLPLTPTLTWPSTNRGILSFPLGPDRWPGYVLERALVVLGVQSPGRGWRKDARYISLESKHHDCILR